MHQLKAWIAAARLRTLPLSVSGIIVGASLGWDQVSQEYAYVLDKTAGGTYILGQNFYETPVFWLAILTTIGFQVLSNFANDYGDGIKGTDSNREGEKRMVASGLISPSQMKKGMYLTAGLSLVCASLLIFQAFSLNNMLLVVVFFGLAIASVIAAVRYTVGKKAYGYSGFGDIFVFVFFGLVAVLGSYLLYTQTMHWHEILPAMSIGLLSVAVLNLNNMRDIENDAKSGKQTLVVKWGKKKSKTYHYVLIIGALITALSYSIMHFYSFKQFLFLIAFIPLFLNMRTVFQNKEPRLLDSELKKVALSTFAFAILFSILH